MQMKRRNNKCHSILMFCTIVHMKSFAFLFPATDLHMCLFFKIKFIISLTNSVVNSLSMIKIRTHVRLIARLWHIFFPISCCFYFVHCSPFFGFAVIRICKQMNSAYGTFREWYSHDATTGYHLNRITHCMHDIIWVIASGKTN